MLKLVALKRSSNLAVFKKQCFCRIILEAILGVPIVHPSRTTRNTCRARKERWVMCVTVRVSIYRNFWPVVDDFKVGLVRGE